MDENLRNRMHQLSERMIDATDLVGSVAESENPTVKEIDAANAEVRDVVAAYQALFDALPEEQRATIERGLGRRLTDLRRLSGKLPQRAGGTSTARASDVPPEGGWPFLMSRPQAISTAGRTKDVAPRPRTGFRVGGEVEAWCGACGGPRDHTIVAVVEDQPKQVICQTCNARHAYRSEPPRKKGAEPAATTASKASAKPARLSPQEADARRREEERFALQRELAEATDVKTFNARATYRAGDIISHDEHGRGKVETVVRGSILVRFRTGLKSLTTG